MSKRAKGYAMSLIHRTGLQRYHRVECDTCGQQAKWPTLHTYYKGHLPDHWTSVADHSIQHDLCWLCTYKRNKETTT